MSGTMNLITAQISVLNPRLALIHIPIELYSAFLQPILRLLFGEDHDEDAENIAWTNRHEFLNITLTQVECSVICTKRLADQFLVPLIQFYKTKTHGSFNSIEIATEDYCVIQVDGQGLDAGQRVLDLTSPLAMAGISIFFITTYFCDYILVPFRKRGAVTKALQQQGFIFSDSADAFVSQLSPSSPTMTHPTTRNQLSSSGPEALPTTPPAKDISELESRTFSKLRRNRIAPVVDQSLRLVNCAGNSDYMAETDEKLKNDLLQVLLSTSPATMQFSLSFDSTTKRNGQIHQSSTETGLGIDTGEDGYFHGAGSSVKPQYHAESSTRFLSITITASDPISVFLEHRLLNRLGSSLLGAKDVEDTLIPITFDLRDLPLEAIGIVCGVAGRLARGDLPGGTKTESGTEVLRETSVSPKSGPVGLANGLGNLHKPELEEQRPVEISFLSTAKTGTVLVKANQLEKAMEALQHGMEAVAFQA